MKKLIVLAEKCDTWTLLLAFLDRVAVNYEGQIERWEEEIYYLEEEGMYKVLISVYI